MPLPQLQNNTNNSSTMASISIDQLEDIFQKKSIAFTQEKNQPTEKITKSPILSLDDLIEINNTPFFEGYFSFYLLLGVSIFSIFSIYAGFLNFLSSIHIAPPPIFSFFSSIGLVWFGTSFLKKYLTKKRFFKFQKKSEKFTKTLEHFLSSNLDNIIPSIQNEFIYNLDLKKINESNPYVYQHLLNQISLLSESFNKLKFEANFYLKKGNYSDDSYSIFGSFLSDYYTIKYEIDSVENIKVINGEYI